jgi:hypothetical protein
MILGAQNAKRIWEPEHDKQLREMAQAGKSVTMMALRLKRTEMASGSACMLSRFIFATIKSTHPYEPASRTTRG